MEVIGFDTETALLRPALLAPPLVCLTWQCPGESPQIAHWRDAQRILDSWFCDGHKLFVGHNVAYDLAVICEAFPHLVPHVFRAYRENRVTDTKIRQQLLDIAGGVFRGCVGDKGKWIKHEYTLQHTAARMAGVPITKEGFRLFYGPLRDVPLSEWPAAAKRLQQRGAAYLRGEADDELAAMEHILGEKTFRGSEGLLGMIAADPNEVVTYPLDDARATLAAYEGQEIHAAEMADQYRQARAAWWLHLSSTWGVRTNAAGVEALREQTRAAYDELEAELISHGLVREGGTRDTKAAKRRMIAVCRDERLTLRRTDTHGNPGKCKDLDGNPVPDGADECAEHVCLDGDACNATGDDVLIDYSTLSTLKKVLSNDVAMLETGIYYPVHTRYDLAETGRTTSSKPNIQNLRRMPGIREAFIPRPGKVFAQADYPQLELYTLAQCCVTWIGWSKLADALNSGLDSHTAVAATILGISYADAVARLEAGDEDVDDARQLGKICNFGFPGGLGIAKLVLFAKKAYGVTLTPERAKQLKAEWFATWTEMPLYFQRINALMDPEAGVATVESLWTERIRGGATYCASCNNGFQGLGADCAKQAGWLITEAQFTDPTSPLYNSRIIAFIHDEFIVEANDNDRAHDVAMELGRLMREGANKYLPDVPITASKMKPLLMRQWSKKAKPTVNKEGRLIPWAA